MRQRAAAIARRGAAAKPKAQPRLHSRQAAPTAVTPPAAEAHPIVEPVDRVDRIDRADRADDGDTRRASYACDAEIYWKFRRLRGL